MSIVKRQRERKRNRRRKKREARRKWRKRTDLNPLRWALTGLARANELSINFASNMQVAFTSKHSRTTRESDVENWRNKDQIKKI